MRRTNGESEALSNRFQAAEELEHDSPWIATPTVCRSVAACTVGTIVTASRLTQPSADIWWTGYGNGPDNSRYFASRQIDKSNIGRLEVAWTYPHGDTGSSPIVVRGVVYGRGRNGSLVAVDATTGKEIWVRDNMLGMTTAA